MTRSGATVEGRQMAGKKQNDATQNLRPDDPVQVLPGGTKTGLPKRRDVFDALAKFAKPKRRSS
jgi:hypothetical protein